jgi:hypothetical protein
MTQPKRTAKVSSAALRQMGDEDAVIKHKRRQMSKIDRSWQRKAFDYAEEVGELGAILNLQANTVALCAFPVRKWSDDQAAWVANDPATDDARDEDDDYDDRPSNVMRAFVGPQGGTEDLIRRAAFNLYCAGEVGLCGSSDDEKNLIWEFLSVEELYTDANGDLVRRPGGLASEAKALSAESYTARCWRSSARYSDLADSEVRRVLPILQEIVTLTQVVDAIAKSQIAANMIFIPDHLTVMSSNPTEDDPDVEDEEELSLVDELFLHLTTPVEDPTSAARVVPLAVTGKANESGKSGIEIIELSRSLDSLSLKELRQEALGRLAQGLDAPPELVSGKSASNHWTAANIDAEFIVKHIQPIGQMIADFITVSYLRPMLETFEDMSEEEAANFKVEFDPSPVIARNDEAKSARDLADWLSDEAILTANGFTRADLASKETIRQRRLWTLISTQPAVYGKLISELEGFQDVDLEEAVGGVGTPLDDEPTAEEKAAAAGTTPPTDAADDDPVPAAGNETPEQPDGVAMALLIERLTTAADGALGRAVEKASNRVVSLAAKHETIRDRVRNKRNAMALITEVELRSLGASKERLLADAWQDFGVDVRRWVGDYLEASGLDRREATDRATVASFRLCEAMQTFTEANLMADFRANGNGLRVPTDLVAPIIEQSLSDEV